MFPCPFIYFLLPFYQTNRGKNTACFERVSNFKHCLHFTGIQINTSRFERQLHFCQKLMTKTHQCFEGYRNCKVCINIPQQPRGSREVSWVLDTSLAPHAQPSRSYQHSTQQLSGCSLPVISSTAALIRMKLYSI